MSQKYPPGLHGARKVAKKVNDNSNAVRMQEGQPGRTGKMAGPPKSKPKHV